MSTANLLAHSCLVFEKIRKNNNDEKKKPTNKSTETVKERKDTRGKIIQRSAVCLTCPV